MQAYHFIRKFVLGVLPVILLLAIPRESQATHIVGGELNYRYLGNDSLYVKIKVYRDSLNADPYFDGPLRFYVYDSSNAFVNTYLIPLPNEADIVPEIDDSCFVEPPFVLVDFVVYEDTLYIPGITPGYTFAYMRCCRNNAILNIEALDFISNDTVPGELTGAVYPAEMPGWTLENGNPEYNTFPPVAICANKLLEYDHSATDPDGDSLVYELCTPYTGGNATFVYGDPILQAPPFQDVLFIPPYSLENVMGGVPLAIDPHSGLLTAVPNTLGRFVIAVCVNEYRDGEFLARHRRDFQFNVVDCSRVFDADFSVSPAPKIDTLTPFDYLFCDTTTTKQFMAELDDPIPVFWDFGDGSTSTEFNPIHTFPDTGSYEVMIVAGPGEICADTMIKRIRVQRHIIGAAFEFEQDPCGIDLAEVSFTDVSTASEPIVQWEWDFGDESGSDEENPIHFFEGADTFNVSLLIYASNGCCTETERLVVTTLADSLFLPDTLATCDGDSVLLGLEIPGDNIYSWDPPESLSDPTVQQPMALPEENTQYIVTIWTPTDVGDTCLRMDTVVVLVEDIIPDIVFETDSITCSQDILINASTDFSGEVQWIWSLNPEFTDTLETGPVLDTVQEMNEMTYYVQASSQWCVNREPVVIGKSFLSVQPEPLIRCGTEDLEVNFNAVSPSGDFTLTWIFDDTTILSNEPFSIALPFGENSVTVYGINGEGCGDTLVIPIENLSLPAVSAAASPQQLVSGEFTDLTATENINYTYAWTPDAGLSDPTIFNPVAQVFETTIYEVLVIDENGCENRDTAIVVVLDVVCDDGTIFIPNAFTPNGDGLNDVFRPTSDVIESMILVIYDRWGNEVFESLDPNTGWDGRSDGVLLPADSYGYLIRIICAGNVTYVKKGNVTLIR